MLLLVSSIVTAVCVYVLATTLPDLLGNVRRDGFRVGLFGRDQITTTLIATWMAAGIVVGAGVVAHTW